jgi:hypothetical protein
MSRESPVEERHLMYLAKAAEARALAQTLEDVHARNAWEQLAKGWEQLALQVKQPLNR